MEGVFVRGGGRGCTLSQSTFSHIAALMYHIHYNLFITRFIITILDITRFKDGSQKCIDYIEK